MTGPSLSQLLDSRPQGSSNPQPQLPPGSYIPTGAIQQSTMHQQPSSTTPIPVPMPPGMYHAAQSTNSPPTPTASSSSSTHNQASPPKGRGGGKNAAGTSNSNLYACRDCGRSYSRPEHLVRHVQTHTLGRRFICEICSKSFARKDLLRRHVANHANDSPAKRRRIQSSPGPGRVSYACKSCASARVKCDESKPCKRCVTRNIECVSSEAGSNAAMHLTSLSAKANAVEDGGVNAPLHQTQQLSAESSPPQPMIPQHQSHQQHQLPHPSAQNMMMQGHDMTLVGNTSMKHASPTHSTPLRHEESQLPTPDTGPEQMTQVDGFQHQFVPATNMSDPNNQPFFDFLRDVLYEQPMENTRPLDPQSMSMLDFCSNNSLELTDMDFGFLDYWNLDGMGNANMAPAQDFGLRPETANEISQMRSSLVRVWTESPWRWQPRENIDSGFGQLGDLPVSARDTESLNTKGRGKGLERVTREKLDHTSRDKVLAMMLATCRSDAISQRVAGSFPTSEFMETMIHIFLAQQECTFSSWLHFPTLKLNSSYPEWIAGAAAAGAVISSVPTLTKFGYAVQEAVRISMPSRFEEDNLAIHDIGLLQSYVLWQDIGLWSGNRRKMEISECHLVIPVTMLRYRGKFQRSYYPTIEVRPEDEGQRLDAKWKMWIKREEWRRLVFHCYIRESQVTMTTLTNPCMSYSELTLPFPEPKELWFAKTAEEWKKHYIERHSGHTKRPPSVGDVLHDIHLLRANANRIDTQFSIAIYLHGFWALILEYRQMCAVHRVRSYTMAVGTTQTLLLNSRHQELVKDLQNFQLIASDWSAVTPMEHLILNLLLMNLHVSLDDLQLFSGKEGEEQARRIYPVLQQWAASADARSASWYAGQVLRYAKLFPKDHLVGFYAVAIHHAALALWTYGVIGRANGRAPLAAASAGMQESVPLDGADSLSVQRFIGFEQGRPTIHGPGAGKTAEAALADTRACMEIAQQVLRSNVSRPKHGTPHIVDNLCALIQKLGDAAWAVGLG